MPNWGPFWVEILTQKFCSKALPKVFSKLGAHLHHLARPVSPSCKEPEARITRKYPQCQAYNNHIMTIQKPSWDDEIMNKMMKKWWNMWRPTVDMKTPSYFKLWIKLSAHVGSENSIMEGESVGPGSLNKTGTASPGWSYGCWMHQVPRIDTSSNIDMERHIKELPNTN